jgi:hypothetical protein
VQRGQCVESIEYFPHFGVDEHRGCELTAAVDHAVTDCVECLRVGHEVAEFVGHAVVGRSEVPT